MPYVGCTYRVFVSNGASAWEYDYDANRWTGLAPVIKPSTRRGHGLAYDAGSKAVVRFGGAFGINGETWVYR